MKTALTIAGSDPSGGAGLQADLKVFRAMGVHGLSIPAALTSQNTVGVADIMAVPHEFFSKQLDCILSDVVPDAVKIGMVYDREIAMILSRTIRETSLRNIVIDPLSLSSTGVPLTNNGVFEVIRDHVLPVARVITPNLEEASALSGIEIGSVPDMKQAADRLRDLGPDTVIITGGHLKGRAVDLLFDGKEYMKLESERLEGDFHGTGCAFSSAVTAGLALGRDVKESAVKAKDFVFGAMKTARRIGTGMLILNL